MAAGKTTAGKKLAESMNCPFIDLDAYIEEKEGKKITDIFQENGEEHFRGLEEKYLQDVLEDNIAAHPETLDDLPPFEENAEAPAGGDIPVRKCTLVLALGGGTIMNGVCAQLIKDLTFCIYLKTNLKTILQRLEKETEDRPMVSLCESIERLYKAREPIYEELGRIKIEL